MKVSQIFILSSLCLYGSLAQSANVEAKINQPMSRIGENMATINVAVSDQDPHLGKPYMVKLNSKTGLVFTPNGCSITKLDQECVFTVSGNEQTELGSNVVQVKSNNAKNTKVNLEVIAPDAERLRFPSEGTQTILNGQIMAGVNGNLLTYSVDGGKSFKHSGLPVGATSVKNIKVAGNNNAARIFINYEGSVDITEINAKNGKVIRQISAPSGATEVSMVAVANTTANQAQKIIVYKNTPTVRLIKKNGNIMDIKKPAFISDWYNLAIPVATQNGGFIISYAQGGMAGLAYAKDVVLVLPNANQQIIAGPQDAEAVGVIRDLQISSTSNGLVALGYNGPTVTIINNKGNQRYETGVADALSVYKLDATQNNQILVSYYNHFGLQNWEGHSNQLKLINADGHAKGDGKSIEVSAPEGVSEGFEVMDRAGLETIVTFYREAYYHVNEDGTNAEYSQIVRPEVVLIDAKGNVSKITPPDGATALKKAGQGGQARLIAYEGTTDMVLIKPDLSAQIIAALPGANGIRWVEGSEQGNFLVTLTESSIQTGQENTLPKVQWVSSNGQTKAIGGQQRIVSGSCKTTRKVIDTIYAEDGYHYTYVYDTVETCDYKYATAHPLDTPVAANGNFLIRYYDGDAVTLVKPNSQTVSINGYHNPNWTFANDGSVMLYNMGELDATYVSDDGLLIKDIKAPNDHQLMYIGNVINSGNNFMVLYAKQSDYLYDYAANHNLWLDDQGDITVVNAPEQAALIPAWVTDNSLYIKRDWAAPTGSGEFNLRYSSYGENLNHPESHEMQIITNKGKVINY